MFLIEELHRRTGLDVADDDTPRHISSAYIYSKFDSGNHDSEATPGCELFVTWPGAWGDLDFTDDCLRIALECTSSAALMRRSLRSRSSIHIPCAMALFQEAMGSYSDSSPGIEV